jgi:hypothetical protein
MEWEKIFANCMNDMGWIAIMYKELPQLHNNKIDN